MAEVLNPILVSGVFVVALWFLARVSIEP